MTKIIAIKELQTNTRRIREEVEQGMHFVVIWRSKPVFEIKPINTMEFTEDFQSTGLYNEDFLEKMIEAEKSIKEGKTKNFKNTADFLNSLS